MSLNLKSVKRLLIFIFSLVFSSCSAQQIVALNDNAIKITLPKEAVSLTKAEATAHLEKNFKGRMSPETVISSDSAQKVFLIKDKLFSTRGSDAKVMADHVSKTKLGLDELFTSSPTYSSFIKRYSDKSGIVISYIHDDVKIYKFYFYSNNREKAATGTLACKSDDKEGADLINKLLKGLKFN